MSDQLTDFVVGSPDDPKTLHFELVVIDGSPNIRISYVSQDTVRLRPGMVPLKLVPQIFPPLNRTGLRRLAKHLEAIADLLEYGKPQKVNRV